MDYFVLLVLLLQKRVFLVPSFRSISCKGRPGSAHDADVLRQSDLFQRAHLLPKVRLQSADIKVIVGNDIPHICYINISVSDCKFVVVLTKPR